MTDVGDWRVPTLQVTPFDGTTTASLEIEDPAGGTVTQTPTSADDTPDTGTQTWTGQGYELNLPGEWIERWTVTGTGASKQRATVLVAPDPAAAPSGIRVYATTGDYATWLRAAPPAGARRALAAASRDVDQLLTTAVYATDDDDLPTDADVAAALRDATCAQAAYAREAGDADSVGAGRITQARIGSVSYTRRGTGGRESPGRYSPQAKQILQQAGLTGHGPWGW